MPDQILIEPVSKPIQGRIRPPGSKSLTNRAVIVAALADGESLLTGVLESDDTRVMLESLERLGFAVSHDRLRKTVRVTGAGGRISEKKAELFLENSGTSIRFLTALCTLGEGEYRLDGNARMRERPIGDLLDALNQLGADAVSENANGHPPVLVRANGLAGGQATVAGGMSSQFLSALLMAAPAAQGPVEIATAGTLVSQPYVEMTVRVMQRFGVTVNCDDDAWRISRQTYRAADFEIEPDASAASYFFAAAAITGGEVTVEGLSQNALQGDVRFVDVLRQMGCTVQYSQSGITLRGGSLSGVDVDMNAISDTAQTLAAVAPFADGPTRIRNIAHVRRKETDRVAAMVSELRRLGLDVEEFEDGLVLHPGVMKPAVIETYDDHRMAMSFALIGLKSPGVAIADPGCTAKTYPAYFDDLRRLCGS